MPIVDQAGEAEICKDRELIEACLAGEAAAWTQLYLSFQEPLLSAIRAFLRDGAADLSLIDEIAARVWYALVRNNGELLGRFDVARGCRLVTFLSVLAKSEARQYFRSERRRRAREERVSRPELQYASFDFWASELTQDEFVRSLTPSERIYYHSVLTSSPVHTVEPPEYSPENGWQLRHRVRKKLDRFLKDDTF